MSIADLEASHELVAAWQSFNAKVQTYEDHKDSLGSSIATLIGLSNYDSIASETEKELVEDYVSDIAPE